MLYNEDSRATIVKRGGFHLLCMLLRCERDTVRTPALRAVAELTAFAPFADEFVAARGVPVLCSLPSNLISHKEVCSVSVRLLLTCWTDLDASARVPRELAASPAVSSLLGCV